MAFPGSQTDQKVKGSQKKARITSPKDRIKSAATSKTGSITLEVGSDKAGHNTSAGKQLAQGKVDSKAGKGKVSRKGASVAEKK